MKIIAKTRSILFDTKAESMVEVVIAFLVLSIVMVLFAHGVSFSNRAERYAIGRSRDSDSAMRELMEAVISDGGAATGVSIKHEKLDGVDNMLKLRSYTVSPESGGDNCVYYVFDADLG